VKDFVEEPRRVFGFVDPAPGGDTVVLVADVAAEPILGLGHVTIESWQLPDAVTGFFRLAGDAGSSSKTPPARKLN
jgi:hypothetical protein